MICQDGSKKVAQAVIFGLGSMFNHSAQEQNVGWERDTDRLIVTYLALRDIAAGEELCTDLREYRQHQTLTIFRYIVRWTIDIHGHGWYKPASGGRRYRPTKPNTVGLNDSCKYGYRKVKLQHIPVPETLPVDIWKTERAESHINKECRPSKNQCS
jgi:hypothetical protein